MGKYRCSECITESIQRFSRACQQMDDSLRVDEIDYESIHYQYGSLRPARSRSTISIRLFRLTSPFAWSYKRLVFGAAERYLDAESALGYPLHPGRLGDWNV